MVLHCFKIYDTFRYILYIVYVFINVTVPIMSNDDEVVKNNNRLDNINYDA